MVIKRIEIDNIPDPEIPETSAETNERIKLRIVDFETEINKINSEALDSTRRMVNVLEETNEKGMETLAALEDQDEQLDKMEANLYRISDDMSKVKNDIKKMEQCCCFPLRKICWPFKRSRKASKRDDADYPKAVNASSLEVKHSFNKNKPELYIRRVTDDIIEDEIEKNLIQVETILESVQHLAIDMDIQLRIQEPKLDRIHSMVENNDTEMDGANGKIKKLLDS